MAIGDEGTGASWADRIRSLEERDQVPAAAANASLLRAARPRWGPIVVARTSMFDLLFTRPGDAYPFNTSVRVSWDADVFEFRLYDRAGSRLVTADRCGASNAPRVLDAFLLQLAGDLASDQNELVTNRAGDEDAEFKYVKANVIVSRSGFSLEVRAPSAIRYAETGKVLEIFAELLVTPEPIIAVRRRDIRAWQDPDRQVEVTESERARIVENMRRALAFKGWVLIVE